MTRLFEAKPFVIAEVGSNWRTLDDCITSIAAAKGCGADAVKFQLFDAESLYGFHPAKHGHTYGDGWQLPIDWLPKLKEACDSISLEFMCTAFSPELVAIVDPFVSVHKVASSDAAWPQMLEAVAKTGKPVLVSTGAKTAEDLCKTMEMLPKAVYMVCTAAYPADYTSMEPLTLGLAQGFSDHTLGYTATVEAARRGAVVIEKHFTAYPKLNTPDRPHSLTPDQFYRMVKLIRGEPVETEEGAMFFRHNRRLIATTDVKPGEFLRYGVNFGAYRSLVDDTRGASPFDWEKVNSRPAKSEIKRGTAIALEDVE
jgi:N,N'-diacetyllegionaminate synthase